MKRLRELLVSLGPTGWLIIAALLAVAFIGLGLARPKFLGIQFDPFGMDQRKIDRLTTERDAEASNGVARGLEVEGEREQAERVEAAADRATRAALSAATAIAEARSAPDANDHLPSDRADRLNRVDDGLCVVSPALAGCTPSPVDPGRSGDAL